MKFIADTPEQIRRNPEAAAVPIIQAIIVLILLHHRTITRIREVPNPEIIPEVIPEAQEIIQAIAQEITRAERVQVQEAVENPVIAPAEAAEAVEAPEVLRVAPQEVHQEDLQEVVREDLQVDLREER